MFNQYFYCVMYNWLHYFCGEWEGRALVNWFNHTSGVTAVTQTDRPKSVRNRCVIKVFGGVIYVVTLLFGFVCGCRGFCHRTESEAKEKYRGVFEIQKSGDKTSSGEIGLDIRTHASPKVGQDQVSGGVSVLCWHAAPVAYVLWKPCTIR